MTPGLRQRRAALSASWERFAHRGVPADVRQDIAASWVRSRRRLGGPVDAAPVDADETVASDWASSPLRHALDSVVDDVEQTAAECDLVAAVTDAQGRILWTAGSRHMRDRAAAVHFVPGGHWDEASVGTNALDLALRTGGPASVFSAEHFSPCVHGWVCYAAALRDPATGEVLGVIDLSTTWDRSHPMALAAVTAFARSISTSLVRLPQPRTPTAVELDAGRGLRLQVLGRPTLTDGDVPLMVTPRQAEILLALALHPAGLTLDALHAVVYGDAPVAPATLKAEISRLRRVVGGALASRPYRLTTEVTVDALDVLAAVRQGNVAEAVRRFVAPVLPDAEAPVAVELRTRLEVAVRRLVLDGRCVEPAVLLAERMPYDLEVVDHALALLPVGAAQRALLEALRAVDALD
jgi:hypothetical protein